jgi:hypothetical protein
MFAHVSSILIFTFWGLLIASTVAGVSACAGSFFSNCRHRWVLAVSFGSIAVGSWVAYEAVQDGAFRHWGWFTVVAFAPVVLGIAALIRWSLLRA